MQTFKELLFLFAGLASIVSACFGLALGFWYGAEFLDKALPFPFSGFAILILVAFLFLVMVAVAAAFGEVTKRK